MIIVTTRHIKDDTRKFCAEWYAIPSYKFDPAILKVNQYAYPDSEIVEDFYKKHSIYYVDNENQNRLVKAYELEEMWDNMTFLDGLDPIGVNGEATTDAYVHYMTNAINELSKRIGDIEARLETLDLAPLEYRITELSKLAVQIGDTINIKMQKT